MSNAIVFAFAADSHVNSRESGTGWLGMSWPCRESISSSLAAVLTGHWHLYDARYRGATLLASVTPLCQPGFMGLPGGYLKVTVGEDARNAEFVPLNARPGHAVRTRLTTLPASLPAVG